MKRPYVILNAAMSLDGKIATRGGDDSLSSREDWIRVHKLRTDVDAIMIGKGTIIADNPSLRVKYHLLGMEKPEKQPIRVVVDSKASLPLTSKIISHEIPTIIATTTEAPSEKTEELTQKGAHTKAFGDGPRVDLSSLLKWLKEKYNVRKLLLEGGGKLNWSMLADELIDEIRIAVVPVVSGGTSSVDFFGGKGFERFEQSPYLELQSQVLYGDCLVLTYHCNYLKSRTPENPK